MASMIEHNKLYLVKLRVTNNNDQVFTKTPGCFYVKAFDRTAVTDMLHVGIDSIESIKLVGAEISCSNESIVFEALESE